MGEVKLGQILRVLQKFRNDEDGVSNLTSRVTDRLLDSAGGFGAAFAGLEATADAAEAQPWTYGDMDSRPRSRIQPYKIGAMLDTTFGSILSATTAPRDPGAPVATLSGPISGFPTPILGMEEDFSIFTESHAEEAADLVGFLRDMPSKEFNSVGDDDTVPQYNKDLFLYALRSAMLSRKDTATLPFPPLWELTARKFFKTDTLHKLSSEVHKKTAFKREDDPTSTVTIALGFSGNERDYEHGAAYFREDLGMNSHHWHWHAVYPTSGFKGKDGTRTFKDRQGELFYYMHEQMLARYDAERLSNGLCRVEPLNNFREPIKEGYASHLSTNGGKEYAMRPSGLVMTDTNYMSVNIMERWRERLFEAIDRGHFILPDDAGKDASDKVNIDRLGDAIEANRKSPNYSYYGYLHNTGHMMLSQIHDPDERYNAPSGVLAYVQTAIRDPLFYRWHKFIDDMFAAYKDTLPGYRTSDLEWKGMTVGEVKTTDLHQKNDNTLHTFWNKRTIDLSNSIDFRNTIPTKVILTHLDHKAFQYQIAIHNATKETQKTTFRIFLAPRSDITKRRLDVNEQRRLFFEMDKFVKDLKPGRHTITRDSTESSVTIPFEKSQEEVDEFAKQYDKQQGKTADEQKDQENYCGCGWPHHLLLPRGTHAGMEMDLFVMITDWEKDKVEGDSSKCLYKKNHASYCGVFDQKYPDKKAMGFPFDQPIWGRNNYLDDFCRNKSNMNHTLVTIEFDDDTN